MPRFFSLRRTLFVRLVVCTAAVLAPVYAAAQTVSAPASQTIVASGNEWASTVFNDPIDMNQYTDVAWWAYSVDQPPVNLSGVTIGACTGGVTDAAGLCFKATTASAGANLWILETSNPFSANLHRNGANFPIDANTYKMVAVRMRVTSLGSVCAVNNASCTTRFLWNQNNLYDGQPVTTSNAFFTYEGWGIYLIDLSTIGVNGPTPWTGTIRDLRYDLQNVVGANIEIDWIRLVPNTIPTQTITWSGFVGLVDIYLDNNATAGDGNQGLIVKNGVNVTLPARNQGAAGSGSYSFPAGALAPGTYFAEVCPAGAAPTSGSCIYSPGSFKVNDIPTLTFLSPSPDGSSDDFATTVLGNPWDMNSLSDLDYFANIAGLTAIQRNDLVTEAGAALGSVNVLQGTGQIGDPQMYLLNFGIRGATSKIDANKYHILTIEAGIPNMARDINGGSIMRMLWQVEGERSLDGQQHPRENVSSDIVFNSRAGANVVAKVTADMKALQIETDPGASPSTTGWVGRIESFRFDPHEFSADTPFYVKRVRLAANEQTSGTYLIQWAYNDPFLSTAPSLTLSYDTDTNPGSGLVTIASGLNPAAGSYSWNTAGVPPGLYYIYASYTDGLNQNATYSRWPIFVGPANDIVATPGRLVISVTKSGSNLIATTPTQDVTVALAGAQAAWTATADKTWVQITNGNGTGSGRFSVNVANPGDVIGGATLLTANITISAPSIGMTTVVTVVLNVKQPAATSAPFGVFDTPVSGPTVLSGSFAVTGWALDDIGIDHVEIWRDLVPGETTPPYPGGGPGNGKVFIANPVFISGARPDVEAAYGSQPAASRAGWGYLLLSWGLWAQGNGTYTLHAYAFDTDGHYSDLGAKTIVVDNAHAVKPFGALDVPGFGDVKSGSFFNFGWALTPNPNSADTRFCTITNGNVSMAVDSGPLQAVNYGALRTDIAGAFPGFSNGTNAGGSFLLDTTTLSNGSHQIGWYVVDNCGRADGVGSRFFNVLNGGSGLVAETVPEPISTPTIDLNPVSAIRPDGTRSLIFPNGNGVRVVSLGQSDRIELELPEDGRPYQGYLRVNGAHRDLPLGSSLDRETGTFGWQPAAGFLGIFDIDFIGSGSDGQRLVSVRVVVGPSMRAAVDTPQSGTSVQQPFVIGGWVADLAAADGTGIDTVHVWAYPAAGGDPIFLGVADIGGQRSDVGAVYGKQFDDSSFDLTVSGLKPGSYNLVVYPHRVATGTFEGAQVVRVAVH